VLYKYKRVRTCLSSGWHSALFQRGWVGDPVQHRREKVIQHSSVALSPSSFSSTSTPLSTAGCSTGESGVLSGSPFNVWSATSRHLFSSRSNSFCQPLTSYKCKLALTGRLPTRIRLGTLGMNENLTATISNGYLNQACMVGTHLSLYDWYLAASTW